MTTVVYDGKTLAADSQVTAGDVICLETMEKIFTPDKKESWWCENEKVLAFALTGEASTYPIIIKMLNDNISSMADVKKYVNLSNGEVYFEAILILESGLSRKLLLSTGKEEVRRFELEPNFTVGFGGSGEVFARAGAAIGLDAVKCVEMAAKLCPYTGGEIKTWTHPGVPKKLSVWTPPVAQVTEEVKLPTLSYEKAKELADKEIEKMKATV